MSIVKEEKSWLEWVVFGLSLLLIVCVVSYLVYDAIADAGSQSEIRISLGAPVLSSHGYMVPVTATNLGDKTAQAVELEIFTESNPPEEASLTYDFLSSGEVRDGWVGFSDKPPGKLQARVVGYRVD